MASANAAIFGADAEEQGHARRRAVIDVGHPHVERHRAELEGDADDQECETEQETDLLRTQQRHRLPIAPSSRLPVTP